MRSRHCAEILQNRFAAPISAVHYFHRLGEVAEWSNAPVLKTGGPQGPVGSNPTLSATHPRSGIFEF